MPRCKCKLCSASERSVALKNRSSDQIAEDARKSKANKLKIYYGLTVAGYEALIDRQDGQCAICKLRKSLVVDHSHATKKVRALLCATCNVAIGMLFDSPELAEEMARYLRKFSKL